MYYFISKSNKLSNSADFLHENKHYQAVPHCSYYACFQLLKQICIDKLGLSENEITKYGQEASEGTHAFTVNQAISYIKCRSEDDSRIVESEIGLLKKIRVRADYKNVEIVPNQSSAAIELSRAIIPILNKYA